MITSGEKLVDAKRIERERDFERMNPSKRVYSAEIYIDALNPRLESGNGSSERLRPESDGSHADPEILGKRPSFDFNFK